MFSIQQAANHTSTNWSLWHSPIYTFTEFLYIWICPWIGSKLTLWFIHKNQGISTMYLLQVTTLNYSNNFTNNDVLIFNKLSSETVNTEPVMKFKKILFNFLTKKSFYSVEEFTTTDSQLANCEWIKTNEGLMYLDCYLLGGCALRAV